MKLYAAYDLRFALVLSSLFCAPALPQQPNAPVPHPLSAPNYLTTSPSPYAVRSVNTDPGGCTPIGLDGRYQFLNGGQLVASVGEPFSGQIAHFLICSGNAVISWGDRIYWGDGADDPVSVPDPFYLGQLVAGHTYSKSAVYPLVGTFGALCYFPNQQPHGVNDYTCGHGTMTVYEDIPLKSLQISCGTTIPCSSVKGGSNIAVQGLVTLTTASVGLGTIVRPTIPPGSPATAAPYVIVSKGATTIDFTISTVQVSAPVTISIYAYSGGVTLSQPLTITP